MSKARFDEYVENLFHQFTNGVEIQTIQPSKDCLIIADSYSAGHVQLDTNKHS